MKGFCLSLMVLTFVVPPVTSLALEEPLPGRPAAGQEESLLPEDTASEAYGSEGGYIHPYISLSGEYTDNLFNVFEDEKSNFLTTISPGIWFALPRTKEVPITIISHNTSAGGLQHQLEEYSRDDFNRHNAYLLGALDFLFYSENSDLNETNGRVEGLYRYNMKNGLSLQILDLFERDTDRFDIGSVTRQTDRKYYSNLLGLMADWEISERLRAKVTYDNFYLDYDEDVDSFLNRGDDAFGFYGYLSYTEKSSFFINYDYVDVAYDDVTFSAKDNEQHFIYVGWDWASTEKTDLLVKLGYQKKNFDDNSVFTDNPDLFAFELQGEHDFTQKTKLITILSHKMEESDSYVASGKTVLAFWCNLSHEFSDRLSALIDLRFENEDYDQIIPIERDDDRFFIGPAVQYIFNDWFMGELAYSYETRSSTQELFDYKTNTFYLRLNFAL
ncbi:MAG: outer membrane beta-barrel protein [Desulfocapsa sp.]|nr:outer membrane beta-barrel protein [Desulfocapsa sp.]